MASEYDPLSRRRQAWLLGLLAIIVLPAVAAPPAALVLALAAAWAVSAAVLPWRRPRLDLARVAVGTATLSLLVDLVYPGPGQVVLAWIPYELGALCILLGRAVRHVADRAVVPVSAAVGTALLALPLRAGLRVADPSKAISTSVLLLLGFLPCALCAGAIGLYLRAMDNRRRHAVRMACREQRLHVAHGLHDFVAHELTGIVLDAQAAQLPDQPPGEQRAALGRIEQATLRALDSIDNTLRLLRETNEDGVDEATPVKVHELAEVSNLVDRFRSGGSAPTTLELAEPVSVLGPEAGAVAYTVVLEALTNVRRHAPDAAHVHVAVIRTADEAVQVHVVDSGRTGAPRAAQPRSGTGLAGLAERIAAHGGSLEAGPTPDGWRVTAVLPTSPTAGTGISALRSWRDAETQPAPTPDPAGSAPVDLPNGGCASTPT